MTRRERCEKAARTLGYLAAFAAAAALRDGGMPKPEEDLSREEVARALERLGFGLLGDALPAAAVTFSGE